MYIDGGLPPLYAPLPSTWAAGPDNSIVPNSEVSPSDYSAPERLPAAAPYAGVVVNISPEGRAAYQQNVVQGDNRQTGALEAARPKECQTCKNRKYQDDSNDGSVSFQAPTHISPGAASSAVASHEREHVSHEQAKAKQEDRRIVSQTVTLHTAICPECGRVYVSGGVTRTLTASDRKGEEASKKPPAGEMPKATV